MLCLKMDRNTWPEGQLAIHDQIVQVLLLELMHLAGKLSSFLAWQHHRPANLPVDTFDDCCRRATDYNALGSSVTFQVCSLP